MNQANEHPTHNPTTTIFRGPYLFAFQYRECVKYIDINYIINSKYDIKNDVCMTISKVTH